MAEPGGALVVGSTGLIGRSLITRLRAAYDPVLGTVRQTNVNPDNRLILDLSQDIPERSILEAAERVRTVFLCGAISRFEDCESDRVGSYMVNVHNTVRLAGLFARHGLTIVFLSSSAVFSGDRQYEAESAAPYPTSEYGRQKAEAEKRLLEFMSTQANDSANVLIVRITKVLSAKLTLVSDWLAKLRNGRSITALDNLRVSPVSLSFATESLFQMSRRGGPGTFHLSGESDVSYYDLARRLARQIGADEEKVVPVALEKSDVTVLYRPRYNSLGMRLTTYETGIAPQSLAAVVQDIVGEDMV